MVRGGETENPAHDGRWPDAHRPAARQTLLLLDSIFFLSRERLNDGYLARCLRWCPVRYYACWVAPLRTLITGHRSLWFRRSKQVEAHRYLRHTALSHSRCVRLRFGILKQSSRVFNFRKRRKACTAGAIYQFKLCAALEVESFEYQPLNRSNSQM